MKNTFLQDCKLPANKVLEFFYYFLCKCSFSSIKLITGLSTQTTSRLMSKAYEIIAKGIDESDTKIGGSGIIVQLDESKFGKRKYNKGHAVEGVWLFGGVEETVERKFFAISVPNRNSKTLTRLILKHVLPGSIIVT
ncbi:hypothetical protein H311_03749, partial [Anncaliia algerae PRA109]